MLVVAAAAIAACSTADTDGAASPGTIDAAPTTTDQTDAEQTDAEQTDAEQTGTDPSATATTEPGEAAPSGPNPQSRCNPAMVNADAGGEPGAGDATTLRIWHGLDGDVVGFFDELIVEFESEHPGLDVEVTRFEGNYTDGIAQLAALDPAERPDVFMGSNTSVRLQYDSELFVPPAECTGGETPAALADLLPIIEHTYTVDDTLMAAPYNVSTPVMMYDRKIWRAAGLDPDDPPATYEELESVVRRLRDSGAATTGMVLYDRAASWLIEQAAAQEDRLLVDPANGRSGTDVTDVVFDTPDAVATLERFRELKREGYVLWAGINQSGRDDLLQLANPDEPSGLTLHTSAAIGDVFRIIESGAIGADVEFGAAPLPGDAAGGLAGGGAWWLLANDDPARVGDAWNLVDWLIQPDRVAELAAFTGYVPTTQRAATSTVTAAAWAERPSLRVGYDQLAAMPASDGSAGLQVGPMVEVQRALEVAASAAIDGDQVPDEQLRAAEDTARSVIDAYDELLGSTGSGSPPD